MKQTLYHYIQELENFGKSNDALYSEKEKRMRNITRKTGELLHFLIKLTKSKYIIEIGTSNGYSTLWIGSAAKENNGFVKTVEVSESKANLAKRNFSKAKLGDRIEILVQDAGTYLNREQTEIADFIFLDSDREHYLYWWENLVRVLKKGGLIAVDNIISHEKELEGFVEVVENTPNLDILKLPIGSGLLLINKNNR